MRKGGVRGRRQAKKMEGGDGMKRKNNRFSASEGQRFPCPTPLTLRGEGSERAMGRQKESENQY